MPTLHRLGAIRICIYIADHNPPHFHALLGDEAAQIDIAELKVLAGTLPKRALRTVLDWAAETRAARPHLVEVQHMTRHRVARVESDPVRRRLEVHWKDGTVTRKDLRRDIARRAIFAPLADPKVFSRVRVLDGGYAIGWPRTEIAFAADGLWYEAHPRELPWPNVVMTAAAFRSWLKSESLSLTGAADLLGLSRRTIAYYASGERKIPRVVFIACMAVASARRRTKRAA